MCRLVRPLYYPPRWWLCHWRSVYASAMWWRQCSLSRAPLCMMPAESSERESQKPRQDKVDGWLWKRHLRTVMEVYLFFLMEICMLFFTLCFSIRLWPFPLWRWSQERNLAWVWPNPGLLHAAKWSKIKSYSLWLRPVCFSETDLHCLISTD